MPYIPLMIRNSVFYNLVLPNGKIVGSIRDTVTDRRYIENAAEIYRVSVSDIRAVLPCLKND